jgi:hypothetical protein
MKINKFRSNRLKDVIKINLHKYKIQINPSLGIKEIGLSIKLEVTLDSDVFVVVYNLFNLLNFMHYTCGSILILIFLIISKIYE